LGIRLGVDIMGRKALHELDEESRGLLQSLGITSSLAADTADTADTADSTASNGHNHRVYTFSASSEKAERRLLRYQEEGVPLDTLALLRCRAKDRLIDDIFRRSKAARQHPLEISNGNVDVLKRLLEHGESLDTPIDDVSYATSCMLIEFAHSFFISLHFVSNLVDHIISSGDLSPDWLHSSALSGLERKCVHRYLLAVHWGQS
jgi:hypothetical protein